MTGLKAHQVSRFLAHPDLKQGIFLVYGPDIGLVRETSHRLLTYFAGDQSASIITLDGAEIDADPARLAVEARTISLFGDQRIIRVRGATKALVMTVTQLSEDVTDLILVLEAGNLLPKDALRSFVEASNVGRALPCYPDSEETLASLFHETFAQHAIRVDAEVLQTLREILGNDREVTRRELEKLTLFSAESKVLTRDDVLLLCADNGATVIDAAIDSMGTGHAEKLELALNRALNSGVDAQRLLRSAVLHFAQLRMWRTQVDGGKSPREVLSSARPKPHFSRAALMEQQLRLWSDRALSAVSERLQQATRDMRRQPQLAETILRRAFLALCITASTH